MCSVLSVVDLGVSLQMQSRRACAGPPPVPTAAGKTYPDGFRINAVARLLKGMSAESAF